jgi:hypothetical protein
MSHARLRIYDDGLCGTPRPLSLLRTEEMERESINPPWTLVTVAPLSSFISLIVAKCIVHEHVCTILPCLLEENTWDERDRFVGFPVQFRLVEPMPDNQDLGEYDDYAFVRS